MLIEKIQSMKYHIGGIVSGINICRDWHGRGIDVLEFQKLLTLFNG